MRIFIVGNINAGKTYVVNKLKQRFFTYDVLSIDEYRKMYGDGTIEKEYAVRQKFADDIIAHKNAIIEFSGGKTITELFIEKLRPNSFVILEINAPLEVCLRRLQDKDFTKIPYPIFSENIEDTVIRLQNEFKQGSIDINFANKFIKKYVIDSSYDIDNLPLKQYETAVKIADHFAITNHQLITFGSLGRGDMTITSDVDLFLITNQQKDEILTMLKRIFPKDTEWLVQKNQIDIYIEDQLVEINVIESLDEMIPYYPMSEIKHIEKTILIGDSSIVPKLRDMIVNQKIDLLKEFDYTIARLEYYARSLSRVSKKEDEYKYYFHNNIVLHEYIRLSYFMTGKSAYAYLPKQGKQYISKDELTILTYQFGDNQLNHYQDVMRLVKNQIEKAKAYRKTKNEER